MRQVVGVFNIIAGIVILYLAFHGLSMYFGGTQADIDKFSKLINEGETTMAVFDSTYTEIKVKRSTSYFMRYSFTVDGKEYTGSHSYDSIDDLYSPLVEIKYLKSNPEINGLQLEEQLAKAQASSESDMDLYLGIGALLVGAYFVFSGLRRFRRQKTIADINDTK